MDGVVLSRLLSLKECVTMVKAHAGSIVAKGFKFVGWIRSRRYGPALPG